MQSRGAERVVNIYICAQHASDRGPGFRFIESGISQSQLIIHYARIEKINRDSKED
jgi:hypothetical protein